MSTDVESSRASAIWLARVRFQIRSYSLSWSRDSCLAMLSGSLGMEVGRMASWASWADLLLVLYVLGDLGAYSAPYCLRMYACASRRAWDERVVESVRM